MECKKFVVALLLGTVAMPGLCADKIRVVNEGGIANEWTLAPGTKLPTPAYPKAYAANPTETGCGNAP